MAIQRLRQWARTAKRETFAIWLAGRDPRVPWYARLLAVAVAAYALSPIDLIPDFVPVLGYVDDVLIVPAGILLVARLIPPALMAEFRTKASGRPQAVSLAGAALVVTLWIAGLLVTFYFLFQLSIPHDDPMR